MSLRIAVIGAGWYGCHIALSLMALGMEVKVFEKHHRPLHEASGNNQFRLHLGFHYARHYGTRMQSRNGYMRFLERYPTLSQEVSENIYAVPNGNSLIDYSTYKLIMVSSGIEFVESPLRPDLLTNIEGMMLTKERVLLVARARQYFSDRLGSVLQLNTTVEDVIQCGETVTVNDHVYDYVIDATWGHHGNLPIPVIYEPTLLLYYDVKDRQPAVTLVDGPLCSVYPTEDNTIYTLSSVPHTPLGRFNDPASAVACRSAVTTAIVTERRLAMEKQIAENFPSFEDRFNFVGIQLGIKTKPIGNFDDRSCQVFQDGRRFSVMSGKIDTIFHATERILSLIEAAQSDDNLQSDAAIKEDIFLPKS